MFTMRLPAASPCCGVTAVGRDGVITAKETATGRVFQFSVKPDMAARMKIGQEVYANFNARQVSLDGLAPCCSITNLGAATSPAGPIDSAAPSTPCCTVVSVNARTGMATARDKATGRTFQFKIQGAAASKLKAGDAIYANFAAGKVSVDGAAPCCTITQ
jgi:hypothetical protein